MIISAHQLSYNPWLGLLHKILLSDIFVVMDDVQFEKDSFINRNKILQNDNEIMLTIPIKTKEYKSKALREMQTLDSRWCKKHLKSIEQSYKKSPYFLEVYPSLEKIYQSESDYLIDYTQAYLDFLIDYIDIDTQIMYASDLKIKAKKLDYVIELTQKVNGDRFVFGALGKSYADEKYMKIQGITPYFQNYQHPQYNQYAAKEFHPYMGVIDLLFNEKKDDIKKIILKDNITKEELRNYG